MKTDPKSLREAMCRSKEAWEHFIFVPLPQARIAKTSRVSHVIQQSQQRQYI